MSDDDAAGSQSLFVVLRYSGMNPYLCSIVQLDDSDLDPPEEEEGKPPAARFLDGKWVAHFKVPPDSPPIDTWVFSSPPSAAGDWYILPDWSYDDYYHAGDYDNGVGDLPLYGAKFNCTSKSFQDAINSPAFFKFGGIAVTVGLDVYFMAHPYYFGTGPFNRVFERYNPAGDSWETLDPFPPDLECVGPCPFFVASAVWDDHTILLNVDYRQIWAYNVSNRKWYHVHAHRDKEAISSRAYRKYGDNRCYAIKGQAFVVRNTIYALSGHFDSVLALSIEKNQAAAGTGDVEYRCSIHSECFVPRISGSPNMSLALLGEDTLCVVRLCLYDPDHVDFHPIQVTYIKLTREEGKMDVANHCIYRLEGLHVQCHIQLCFSLPKCKTTTASSDVCSTFMLNPLREREDSDEDVPLSAPVNNSSSQTKITDEQDFEQHSVVRSYLIKHLKKRKMSEINKEPKELHVEPRLPMETMETILNMLRVLDQKLDNLTQHLLIPPVKLLRQPSQTPFHQNPSAPSSSLDLDG